MGEGLGHAVGKTGEWMHADFQYEYHNDSSFFHAKSHAATQEWKEIGQAISDDPVGTLFPGVMAAYRNPSASTYGMAAVDIGLILAPWAKGGQAAGNVSKVGRVGRAAEISGNVGRIAEEAVALEKSLLGKSGATNWGKPQTLADHFARHGKDFGAKNAFDYARKASDFFQQSQKMKLPTKIGPDGTIRIYDPRANTFGSYRPDGATRTFYKPNASVKNYWNIQPGNTPWTP